MARGAACRLGSAIARARRLGARSPIPTFRWLSAQCLLARLVSRSAPLDLLVFRLQDQPDHPRLATTHDLELDESGACTLGSRLDEQLLDLASTLLVPLSLLRRPCGPSLVHVGTQPAVRLRLFFARRFQSISTASRSSQVSAALSLSSGTPLSIRPISPHLSPRPSHRGGAVLVETSDRRDDNKRRILGALSRAVLTTPATCVLCLHSAVPDRRGQSSPQLRLAQLWSNNGAMVHQSSTTSTPSQSRAQ